EPPFCVWLCFCDKKAADPGRQEPPFETRNQRNIRYFGENLGCFFDSLIGTFHRDQMSLLRLKEVAIELVKSRYRTKEKSLQPGPNSVFCQGAPRIGTGRKGNL